MVCSTRSRAPRLRTRAGKLGATLDGPFDSGENGPGGWILLFEPERHLHGEILVPDFAGWRRERMPRMPDAPAFELAPDWVCEVLSPATAATDRAQKMPIYARERVAFTWLVDPLVRTLEAYRLEAGRWLQVGVWRDEARARIEPFEAIEFDLAVLWSR